jgi:TspO/MBR family protein
MAVGARDAPSRRSRDTRAPCCRKTPRSFDVRQFVDHTGLIGRLALCLGVAVANGSATYPEIPTWYASLTKPSWTPPNWVFPLCLERPLRDDGRESVAAVGSSCRYARTTNGDHAFPPAAGAQCRLVAGLLWAPRYGSGAGDYPPAACRNCGHDPGSVAHATGGGLASGSYLAWIVYAATLNAGIVTLNAAQELIHCPALGHVCQRARWVGTSVTRANRCSAEDPGVVSASPAGKALTSDGRSRLDLGRG